MPVAHVSDGSDRCARSGHLCCQRCHHAAAVVFVAGLWLVAVEVFCVICSYSLAVGVTVLLRSITTGVQV